MKLSDTPESGKAVEQSWASIIGAMVGCAHRHVEGTPYGAWIMEFGAGNGQRRNQLLQLLSGKRYIGIESERSLSVHAAYVSQMPFETCPKSWNDRFHFICSRNTMEHMLDGALAMATIKRLLAPNGIVGHVSTSEHVEDAQHELDIWRTAYMEHGFATAYAVVEGREQHLVLLHDDWPLKD